MKNKITKKIVVLAMMIMTVLSATLNVNAATTKKVRLSQTSAILTRGKTLQLSVNNTKKTVKWSTSDSTVASVSSKGLVKALKKGNVIIYATVGKTRHKCSIQVINKTVGISKCSVKKDNLNNLVVIYSNTSSKDKCVQSTVTFYKKGKVISMETKYNLCAGAKTTCAMKFNRPYLANKYVAYDDYSISFVTSDSLYESQSKKFMARDVTAYLPDKKVYLSTDMPFGLDTAEVIALFYDKNGKLVGCSDDLFWDNGSIDFPEGYEEWIDNLGKCEIICNNAYVINIGNLTK